MSRAFLFTAAVLLLALLLLASRPVAVPLVGSLAWDCGFAAIMIIVPTTALLLLTPALRSRG